MGDESSKRLKASIGEFSELTALSQRAINNALAKLAEQNDEITHVVCKGKRGDSLDAKIEQPLVSLKVTDSSRADLEYFCKFTSGTLFFNYDPPEQFDVAGWTVAFNVKIGSVDIEPGSDEDTELRSVIQQPGDFSIKSLFLTFNQGDIIKPNLLDCDFQNASLDEDDVSAFGAVLAKWYIDESSPMCDRRNRTIGYGLHTAEPQTVNEGAPSFPPTSLKYQTYEYIGPGEQTPLEGLESGGNNMLLYLQMTDNKSFPTQAILPYTGNFVSDGMDGTMCVGREIFWDRYLLRDAAPQLLHMFNHSTYAWVQHADVDSVLVPKWTIGIGDSGHTLDPGFFRWNDEGTTGFEWSWNPQETEQHWHKFEKHDDGGCDLEVTCTTGNKMATKSGSNAIQVSGETHIKIHAQASGGVLIAPWDYYYTIHVWIEWATTITLAAVQDGGIEISLNLPSDMTQAFQVKSDPIQSRFDAGFNTSKDALKDQHSKLQSDLIDHMKNLPLRDVETKLQNDLNSAARFVAPGGGTFTYQNPMFNDNGDLLIEVGYKA
ncbi:hypothetical protein F4779DRAFT_501814 [Xylariaceae sp. FL0662B]|nr:hypothetical protein F4779DRAFT_501814 [Xylariaceae sp. FL0662B]